MNSRGDFYYPQTEERRREYLSLLVEGNQEWAGKAGVLFFLGSEEIA